MTGRATRDAQELDGLETEEWTPGAADLDLRSTAELVSLMNIEDAGVPAAVAAAHPAIVEAVDTIADRLRAGGRLVYVGAGTSGRLALVDAVECESTFGVPPGASLRSSPEARRARGPRRRRPKTIWTAGVQAIRDLAVDQRDVVVGLSASGRTPYVLGAIAEARTAGAATVAVVSVDGSELGAAVDHEIAVVVGPEVIAGSTRLKAGTAQKLVLNTISTITMVRLGKTFGNLMVDVVATNTKLRARVRRIVCQATGASPERADAALADADGEAKVAIVALLADLDAASARARLESAGGDIRKALVA